MQTLSDLQKARIAYPPKFPLLLAKLRNIHLKRSSKTIFSPNASSIASLFPKTHGLPSVSFVEG